MSEMALQLIREAKEKKLKSLDLGNCGLTGLPEELFELTELEELVLGSGYYGPLGEAFSTENKEKPNKIFQISVKIKKLSKLKKLILGDNQNEIPIFDLSPIRHLKQIKFWR